MPKNVVYYYDHEAGTFVALEPGRRVRWLKTGAGTALVLVIAAVGVGVLAQTLTTPTEVAQQSEIEMLREQLEEANTHLDAFSTELAALAETDRELYRTVLHADPVSEDRFGMGAGGARDERFGRFSTPTRELLTETSATFDRLERQLALQRRSYAELRTVAGRREAVLRQQPAILPLRDARMTSGYGMRFHPVLHVTRLHAGVDFATASGTPVYATGDGVVGFVGTRGGYGTVVEIRHPLAGRLTRYAHLTTAAPGLRPGSLVRRGQTVAYSGHSGLSTAPHLHYEVRQLDAAQTSTDPIETFVPGVTPAEYRDLLAASRSGAASFD
ncbi:MAG TPA: peptidoglycan DD-metalloendopeptidase family protein [Rubricoccaceae bacterium]|jgi:murein DD-endopeptidase MepM/ murein hydrolase activator NlpD